MARIPESEVERLNREISPVRVSEGAGLRLVRQGQASRAAASIAKATTLSR